MSLLSSLRGKQGGDAIRQSTTTATMHLLEQNRKFEAFMRDKVATLERQVAEDDGRLNRSDGDEEGNLTGETDAEAPAEDLEANEPGEGQATSAGLPAGAGYEEVAVIGEDTGGPDEEPELPADLPPARPTAPVPPPPPPVSSPKAASAMPDWRAFLGGEASTTAAPGAPAAEMEEPAAGDGDQVGAQGKDVAEEEALTEVETSERTAGKGDQVDAQGEDAAEEEAPVEAEVDEPPSGEGGQIDAQSEDIVEEEAGGGGLFAMNLPIISLSSAATEPKRASVPPATAPSAAVPSAPPATAKASPSAPTSDVATQGPDADDQSSDGWDQAGLQGGQVGSWA
jgi:hypothetical protein